MTTNRTALLGAVAAGLALLSFAATNAGAHPSGQQITPSGYATVDAARSATPPNIPITDAQIHAGQSAPFRPTMGDAAYAAAKNAAAAQVAGKGARTITPDTVSTLKHFSGLTENSSADGSVFWPSDSNGAIGTTQYCEITNAAIAMYSRTGSLLKTTPLSSFFGGPVGGMFDPICKFDRQWNRWIFTATSFPTDATHMNLYMAFSQTSDATGGYWLYSLNVAFHSGDFWDYEKVGITQDALLFDANIFNGSSYNGATVFALAKQLVYNGRGFSTPLFEGLGGTLALPIITTQDPNAYLIYNEAGSNEIGVYTLTNAAFAYSEGLSGPVQVATTFSNAVPPAAPQPGTTQTLDTLDGRFENNTVQAGGEIFGATCVALGGFPANYLVEINGANGTLDSAQPFYVSGSSSDFNPNVARDDAGDIGVEWSATDTNVNAEIVCSGATYGNALATETYTKIKGSTTHLTGNSSGSGNVQRWGDYSSLCVDPNDGLTFWGTNQDILTTKAWGTEDFDFKITP